MRNLFMTVWIPAFAGMTKGKARMTKNKGHSALDAESIINIMDSRLRGNDERK